MFILDNVYRATGTLEDADIHSNKEVEVEMDAKNHHVLKIKNII